MDLEFVSSIPCTPLLLSTSRISLARRSLTGATQVAAVIIATQGAAALSPCRSALGHRGDHLAAQLALAPPPTLPSTTPRPLDTGFGRPRPHTHVPVHAQRRPSSHRARAERPPCRARATPPHALSETLASPLLPRTRIVDVAHPTIALPPSCAAPKPYPSSNTSPAHWTRTAPSWCEHPRVLV